MPKTQTISENDIIKTLHLTIGNAADILNCSYGTVRRLRIKYGYYKPKNVGENYGRPKSKFAVTLICEYCNNKFLHKRKEQKYCSETCYHNSTLGRIYTEETKRKISNKAIERWKSPTKNMVNGIEKRKLSKEDLKEYKKYRNKLKTLTEYTYAKYKDEINPNNYKRGVAGMNGAYHLDHVIPARFGYENNIPPEILAEKENLQMLPWRANIVKGKNYEK